MSGTVSICMPWMSIEKSKNSDAFLRVFKDDAGILLDSLNALDECPVSVLKAHPLSMLVLMRSIFN